MIKNYFLNLKDKKDKLIIQCLPSYEQKEEQDIKQQLEMVTNLLDYLLTNQAQNTVIDQPYKSYKYMHNLISTMICSSHTPALRQLLSSHFSAYFESHLNNVTAVQLQSIYLNIRRVIEIVVEIFRADDDIDIHSIVMAVMKQGVQKVFNQGVASSLVQIINSYRNNTDISYKPDLEMLVDLVELFNNTGLYQQYFHPVFIQTSVQYYQQQQNHYLQSEQSNIIQYVKFIESSLMVEQQLHLIFYKSNVQTYEQLIEQLQDLLIKQKLELLLGSQFEKMIEQEQKDGLAIVYKLVVQTNNIEKMKSIWNSYIKFTGCKFAQSPTVIQQSLQLHTKLQSILNEQFNRSTQLQQSFQFGFDYFMNQSSSFIAEQLSKELDKYLKIADKTGKDSSSQQLESVLKLFQYIQAKDVFEGQYMRKMVRRVIQQGINENEQIVVEKLKQVCGGSYTKRMEDVFRDLGLSQGINQQYKEQFMELDNQPSFQFNIHIFSSNTWPLANNSICLPDSLQSKFMDFINFYQSRHQGHLLKCQLDCSYLELIYYCGDQQQGQTQKYYLTVSLLQGLLLIAFNKVDSLSIKDMADQLVVDIDEIKKSIIGFYRNKSPQESMLLIKQQDNQIESKDNNIQSQLLLNESSIVYLNPNFHSKSRKIKLSEPSKKDSKEVEETTQKVLHERQWIIESAIVMIMKLKKQMKHSDLIHDVMEKVRLPISVAEVKKRIDNLIGRDYLERDEQDMQMYRYLA